MQGKVTVVARFRAKAGKEDDLKKLLLALIEPGRLDDGCINYDLHQAIDDPALFIFYENWQSRKHLERHSGMIHVRDFRSRANALLAEAPELTLLKMIGG